MTNGELRELIIAEGYTHSWDSDYNRDVFCKTNMMVSGVPTKLEVYVDYYSATVVWWYESTKQISVWQSLEKLNWENFKAMANNLVIKNKRLMKK